MPVAQTVDNDAGLFVVRLSGLVTAPQLIGALAAIAKRVSHAGSFCSLLIFEHTVDLSEMDIGAMQSVRREMKDLYRRLKSSRRAGAAVVDASYDAKLLVPLWNALAATDPELDLHYEIFTDIGPALAWLDVPPEIGMVAAERTE